MHSPEEIELLIPESRDGGLLEPVEQVRLIVPCGWGCEGRGNSWCRGSGLSIMDAATPCVDVLHVVAASPFSRLACVRAASREDIVGVLHTKDVVDGISRAESIRRAPRR